MIEDGYRKYSMPWLSDETRSKVPVTTMNMIIFLSFQDIRKCSDRTFQPCMVMFNVVERLQEVKSCKRLWENAVSAAFK